MFNSRCDEYDVCQYADKQSEKMLCEDRDAKYKSDLFIQNMSNVLRATLYQKLKMVDLIPYYSVTRRKENLVECEVKLTTAPKLRINWGLIWQKVVKSDDDVDKGFQQSCTNPSSAEPVVEPASASTVVVVPLSNSSNIGLNSKSSTFDVITVSAV
ncbi:hypothetical protein Tco_0246285 [Tanacetum coccineum]